MAPADIDLAMRYLDSHKTLVLLGGTVSLIGGFLQFIELIRLGFRHHTHAVPLPVNLFWFANDLTYVLLYHRWFYEVPDPVFRHAWFLWIPFVVMEMVIAFQIIQHSHLDVFGCRCKVCSYAIYGGLQVAMLVFFLWLSEALNDYFLFVTSMLTVIGSNMGFVLLARRRNRKGQSLYLATILLINQGYISFFVLFPAESPVFTTASYYALATVVTLSGWVYWYLLWRAPSYSINQ